MNKLLVFAPLALVASSPALAADKSDAMKWEAGFQVLSAIDAAETIYALESGKASEANPLFGKHPSAAKVIIVKALVGGVHYALVDRMANKNPKGALRVAQVSVMLQGTVVGLNARFVF